MFDSMTITETRLENTNKIIERRFGGVRARFARHIGKEATTIGRWWAKQEKHKKNIGHQSARHIESRCGLPEGWLDIKHDNTFDLEEKPQKKYILKAEHGDTHIIPLRYSATLSQKFQLSIIDNKKGKLMLLSTDGDAYAFQLIGHNPNPILTKKWGLVVEPDTPLAEDEYTIIYLKNGEILLRMFTYQDEEKLLVSHPVTGEQQEILRSQLDKALYCYVGIPPSKIMEATE